MSCPALAELPLPHTSKTGWPWTEESPQLPENMPDGSLWPRISIVTPSYNQGQFIEETIRSVLLQGYPNLDYIIIDGGSTDGSVEIIKKYEPWLTYWVSEPDQGQSHAINKGWERATGEWLTYLNSDDYLEIGALYTVANSICSLSDEGFIFGGCNIVDQQGEFIRKYRIWDYDFKQLIQSRSSPIPQQSTFIKRDLLFLAGLVDPSFHMAMDYDLWIRLGLLTRGKRIEETLGNWRYYIDTKTKKYPMARRNEHLRCYLKLEKNSKDIDLDLQGVIKDQIVLTLKELSVKSWKSGRYLTGTKYAMQALVREPKSILKLRRLPSIFFSK